MAGPRYAVEDLAESTCLQLLRTVPVGRVGFTLRALPKILPVFFTVRADEVVIAIHGYAAPALQLGEIVAFEVDAYDPSTREQWCVCLVGCCRPIIDCDEVTALNALEFASWSSDEGTTYIGISIEIIHGQTVSAVTDARSVVISDR